MASVTAVLGESTQVTLHARQHSWRADEPPELGGTDTGPTPYELLLGSLAACTLATLRLYANHKGIELGGVEIELSHGRIHARDCEDCESTEGRIDQFERELVLTGSLSEEQRQRMLEIADRCPVHRTLHAEVKVRTSLADS